MATRSGRRYRPAERAQTSVWVTEIELLSTVVKPYLELHDMLVARTVCKAWSKVWGSCVPGLMLEQPLSVAAARSMGRNAAAAFSSVSKARITLYHNQVDAHLDLTSSDSTGKPVIAELPVNAERPQAARALVCQLQQLPRLCRMHFSVRGAETCNSLHRVVPHLPNHLQVLDLTEVGHSSSILPMIAAHLPLLQRLALGLTAPWSNSHMAALAALPSLRELECGLMLRLPSSNVMLTSQDGGVGLRYLTQVTSLRLKLHMPAVSEKSAASCASAYQAIITELPCMAALNRLKVQHLYTILDCYSRWWRSPSPLVDAWRIALAGLQQLEHLDMRNVYITDGLLHAAALAPLKMLVLHFGVGPSMDGISAAGAKAVAHVPEIEVGWGAKGGSRMLQGLYKFAQYQTFCEFVGTRPLL